MEIYGTLVNCVAVIVGSCIGLCFRNALPERISQVIENGLGICTFVLGIKMALEFQNVLVMIACVIFGGIIGTLINLELNIERLAHKVQSRFSGSEESRFAKGFTMTSILYCTGAMAVVGSIKAGIAADFEVLYMKSMIDGIFSISFAALYGVGVAFSAISILIYQGTITLLSTQLHFLAKPEIINDISGVGGILIAMIGLNITGIKKLPVGNFLPAIPLVMVLAGMIY